jgi:hypothetical protein
VVTPEEIKALQSKIDRLKNDQTILQKQISVFQEAVVLNHLKNAEMAA